MTDCRWCQHPDHPGQPCRTRLACPDGPAPCPCDTLRQLRRIPPLAAEVWLTRDAPNPAGHTGRHSRNPNPDGMSRAVAILDATRTDNQGLLARTLIQAVRAVWDDAYQAAGRDETPMWHNPPSWAGEARWLTETRRLWAGDNWRREMVTTAAREAHTTLERLAGETPGVDHMWLECPRLVDAKRWHNHQTITVEREPCGLRQTPYDAGGNPTRLRDAAYCSCPAGHVIRHWAEIARLTAIAEGTAAEIAKTLALPFRRVQKWTQRGLLKPVGRRRLHKTYLIADAARLSDLFASEEKTG